MCRLAFVAAVLTALAGCSQPPASTERGRVIPRPPDVAAVRLAPSEIAGAIRYEIGDQDRAPLDALYAPERYAPLWIDGEGRPTAAARDAVALLAEAPLDGLNPSDYRVTRLAHAAEMLQRSATAASVSAAAAFDVGLSLGVLRYCHDLHQGRVGPRATGDDRLRTAAAPDYASVLRAAIRDGRVRETARDLAPALAPYAALREGLARYRALAADSALEPPPRVPTTVHPHDPYAAAPELERWLAALGDLPPTAPAGTAAIYDEALVEGVRRFQIRHGLEPDGVLGRATQGALSVPLDRRVRQIELSLERLRWFPSSSSDRLVLVNIPMFRLWAFNGGAPEGEPAFATKVIVGRALTTPTPLFAAEMRHVIFRPYWNVPLSIARNEILPALAREPRYLDEQNMEIVLGQGDDAQHMPSTPENIGRVASGLLRIRQRPGPKNALGLIKFMFPNEENVYLHGTPAPELFAQSRRDFSHGCVRVEDPTGLAEWVLADPTRWSREAIAAAAAGPHSSRVDLGRPVQVVLFYATAWVTPADDGVHFADDIYGGDAALEAALRKNSADVR